jgi:hypothetical protein
MAINADIGIIANPRGGGFVSVNDPASIRSVARIAGAPSLPEVSLEGFDTAGTMSSKHSALVDGNASLYKELITDTSGNTYDYITLDTSSAGNGAVHIQNKDNSGYVEIGASDVALQTTTGAINIKSEDSAAPGTITIQSLDTSIGNPTSGNNGTLTLAGNSATLSTYDNMSPSSATLTVAGTGVTTLNTGSTLNVFTMAISGGNLIMTKDPNNQSASIVNDSDMTVSTTYGNLNLESPYYTFVRGGGGTSVMEMYNGYIAMTANSGPISMTVPNETNVAITTGGKMSIDQTGLTSGNDPIYSLKNVDGNEATIRKQAAGSGDALFIDNNAPIIMAPSGDQCIKMLTGGVTELTGDSSQVRFLNATAVQKATLNYADLTTKVTLECPGSGEVALDAGTGGLTLATDGDLVLDGAAIISATAGSNSGQHLRIKLNGVYYKIKLEND